MKCRIVGIGPLAKHAGNWAEQASGIMGGILSENRNIMMMIVSDNPTLRITSNTRMLSPHNNFNFVFGLGLLRCGRGHSM